MNNIIKYTSRTYNSIMQDLITQLSAINPTWTDRSNSDIGVTLIQVCAYLTDLIQFFIDKMVCESYVGTAVQRGSLIKMAKEVDWAPFNFEPSTVLLTFYLDTLHVGDVIIPAGTVCSATINRTTYNFYTTEGSVILSGNLNAVVLAAQGAQSTLNLLTYGARKYQLVGNQISSNPKYVSVVINGVVWTYVETFKDSLPSSQHYTIEIDEDYNVYIVFGDGTFGILPSRLNMIITYNQNAGRLGQVPVGVIKSLASIIYDEFDNAVAVKVTNNEIATGAADPPNNNLLRYVIESRYIMQDRAVTKEDFEALILTTGYVKQVKVYDWNDDRNIGGYKIKIYVLIDGGLTTPLLTNLSNLLDSQRYVTLQYEIVNVGFVNVAVGCQVKTFPGADFYSVKNAISSVLSTYFTPAMYGADGLLIGQDIRYSDIVSLVDGLTGVDYIELTLNGAQSDIIIGLGNLAQLASATITQI
jgi:hypothetical protein